MCPLFKKGDKSIASNYRPISLTSILCKVLEHIFALNLVTHLDSHKLLYDIQHGFRSKRSCETQLVMLMEDLSRSDIKGQQTDLILLDFSKAFDKVSHKSFSFSFITVVFVDMFSIGSRRFSQTDHRLSSFKARNLPR